LLGDEEHNPTMKETKLV